MPHTLVFEHELEYLDAPRNIGITIEITLVRGHIERRIPAKIDTGADYCIFQRDYAEALNLDVTNGELRTFDTAGGPFTAWGHYVTIRSFDFEHEALVFFADTYGFKRNLLGRRGWLEHVQFGTDRLPIQIVCKQARMIRSIVSSKLTITERHRKVTFNFVWGNSGVLCRCFRLDSYDPAVKVLSVDS